MYTLPTFNGHNIRIYDFANIEKLEKNVKILEKHASEISNACYVTCTEYDGIKDTMKYRQEHLPVIQYIDYGHNGNDAFIFGIAMEQPMKLLNHGVSINITHVMEVLVVVINEDGDGDIKCIVEIKDDGKTS